MKHPEEDPVSAAVARRFLNEDLEDVIGILLSTKTLTNNDANGLERAASTSYIHYAATILDYRDVLYWAEYPEGLDAT